jgi:hypothetical protein
LNSCSAYFAGFFLKAFSAALPWRCSRFSFTASRRRLCCFITFLHVLLKAIIALESWAIPAFNSAFFALVSSCFCLLSRASPLCTRGFLAAFFFKVMSFTPNRSVKKAWIHPRNFSESWDTELLFTYVFVNAIGIALSNSALIPFQPVSLGEGKLIGFSGSLFRLDKFVSRVA